MVRVGLAFASVILLIVGGWVLWRGIRERAAVPLDKSRIAVLPFIDLSAEGDSAYFADGMTEELITQLSQIHGLTVIARTSVMKYKGTLKDVATIGRELRVGTILEGSVRRMDNQVRISAQLIDVASQGHLWSQEYDRELTGVFDIQSDIATRVAQRLKVQLSAGEKRRIEEPGDGESGGLHVVFTRALPPEPVDRRGFAQGDWVFRTGDRLATPTMPWHMLASRMPTSCCHSCGGDNSAPGGLPARHGRGGAGFAAGRSFAIVHTAVASAKLWYAWDWDGAEAAFKHALALSPNDAATHRRYAWFLIASGRGAGRHRRHASGPGIESAVPGDQQECRPGLLLGPPVRPCDGAVPNALEMDPNFRMAYSGLVYACITTRMYAEALAACQQMVERWGRDPWMLWDLGYAYAVSGQRDQARQVRAELHEHAQHVYVKPLAFAWIAIGLDEMEQALYLAGAGLCGS